ncbi:RNA polymerase sigma-70 factor [Luteipulveratus mongoliensis]|uniref:RNA polymerase sigma24 factor n=1 Tax=Luteipulveratus mongoliensis TaxID=571913 RepID=A0A0K1JJY0_9MICO|nr:RNA polymerase sigma-70 factor [Luteipulveratus mongoliensis]AKU17022.1 RNA polymerase sigma24 factor [Luteipulveratus mongoliensis]
MTAEEFTSHRPLLFSIAYEILGSVTAAEDAVQDSYLRWQSVDQTTVEHPRAYLAKIVTRQALTMLRAASRRREDYVGPWLPEPIETSPDSVDHVLTGEAVTTAMMLVLETLNPTQRAVFVLREVFAFSYPEIAAAVDKTEAAVRQINHRARERVHERRQTAVATPAEAQIVAERFMAAAATGDIDGLMKALAPDVVFIGDGGGVVTTVRRPVEGQEKVARLVLGLLTKGAGMGEMDIRVGVYNGMPAVVVHLDGVIDQVTSMEVRGDRVTAIYCVRNPEKLTSVGGPS